MFGLLNPSTIVIKRKIFMASLFSTYHILTMSTAMQINTLSTWLSATSSNQQFVKFLYDACDCVDYILDVWRGKTGSGKEFEASFC